MGKKNLVVEALYLALRELEAGKKNISEVNKTISMYPSRELKATLVNGDVPDIVLYVDGFLLHNYVYRIDSQVVVVSTPFYPHSLLFIRRLRDRLGMLVTGLYLSLPVRWLISVLSPGKEALLSEVFLRTSLTVDLALGELEALPLEVLELPLKEPVDGDLYVDLYGFYKGYPRGKKITITLAPVKEELFKPVEEVLSIVVGER